LVKISPKRHQIYVADDKEKVGSYNYGDARQISSRAGAALINTTLQRGDRAPSWVVNRFSGFPVLKPKPTS
jgi:hypothetical protein